MIVVAKTGSRFALAEQNNGEYSQFVVQVSLFAMAGRGQKAEAAAEQDASRSQALDPPHRQVKPSRSLSLPTFVDAREMSFLLWEKHTAAGVFLKCPDDGLLGQQEKNLFSSDVSH